MKIDYKYNTDRDGNLVSVEKVQDVEPIISAVSAYGDLCRTRRTRDAAQQYVGSIPTVLGLQLAKESGTKYLSREWIEVVKKKMKDPDFKKLVVRNI